MNEKRLKLGLLHKKKPVQILLVMFILGLLFSLTGCLTEDEQQELDEFEITAAKYYEEKYGETPQIEDCGFYVVTDNLFPYKTALKYAKCADKTIILYDADRDLIADNRQSSAISSAIEKEWAAQLEQVPAIVPGSELVIQNFDAPSYFTEFEDSFYHTYYDGDIIQFLKNEDVQLSANIYLICQEQDPWQDAQKKCEEIIRQYFRTDNAVTFNVLSRECYEVYQDMYGALINIGKQGCFAKYEMTGKSTKSYIQSFIKIVDGIYATCNEPDFVFEEGDIIAIEAISEDELNATIFAEYDKLPDHHPDNKDGAYLSADKAHTTYSVASSSSPIYRFMFSDRVKAAFPNGKVTVYMTYIPEEVQAAEGDQLMRYEENVNRYKCEVIIPANQTDGEWETIDEQSYYFIGSVEVMGPLVTEPT